MKRHLFLPLLFLAVVTLAAPARADAWLENYQAALAQAKKENKLVLANFTGSDWCPGCIMLEKQILSTPQFLDYAQKNLVLLLVDFPYDKPQLPAVAKQNAELQEKYGVEGFPTLMLLTGSGKVVAQRTGYRPESPEAYIAWIEAQKK